MCCVISSEELRVDERRKLTEDFHDGVSLIASNSEGIRLKAVVDHLAKDQVQLDWVVHAFIGKEELQKEQIYFCGTLDRQLR